MKDTIKRTIVIILFGLFLAYIIYLMIKGEPVVQAQYLNINRLYEALMILLCLFMIVCYGVYPITIKFSKPILFVLGVACITIGYYVLANDGSKGVFVGDLFSVLGVAIIFLFPTNVLMTEKGNSKKKEKGIEIIEV